MCSVSLGHLVCTDGLNVHSSISSSSLITCSSSCVLALSCPWQCNDLHLFRKPPT
jgi:hypothetical protein